jgi:hypothetical protein
MTESGEKIVLLVQEDGEAAASCGEISYLMTMAGGLTGDQ